MLQQNLMDLAGQADKNSAPAGAAAATAAAGAPTASAAAPAGMQQQPAMQQAALMATAGAGLAPAVPQQMQVQNPQVRCCAGCTAAVFEDSKSHLWDALLPDARVCMHCPWGLLLLAQASCLCAAAPQGSC